MPNTLSPGAASAAAANWAAFNAIVAALAQISSGTYDTAQVACRWAGVTNRTQSGSVTIAIAAHHAAGVDHVNVYLNGGAAAAAILTLMPSGLYRWIVTLNTALVDDALSEIRAIVYPVMGYARVLSGPFDTSTAARCRGEHSFFVNCNNGGTLPVAHVYCNSVTGSDSNDGSSGSPFASIDWAIRKLKLDGTRDGGIIHVTGNVAQWPGQQANTWDDNDQYCTVSLEGTATITATATNLHGLGCTLQRIVGADPTVNKIIAVTIGQATDTSGHLDPWLWIDNVGLDGVVEDGAAGVISAEWTKGWCMTQSSVTNVDTAVGLATYLSGIEISNVSEDALVNNQGLIEDITVHDQWQAGAGHADLIQMNRGFGATDHEVVENTIYEGIRSYHIGVDRGFGIAGVQGFFLRSNSDVGTHKDIAIVNCDFSFAGNSQILHDVDHLIIRHAQFLKNAASGTGGSLLIIDDASGGWPTTTITNISVRNSVFDNLTATWSGGTDPTTTSWADNNHYITTGSYGTNYTTGSTYAALFNGPATENYAPKTTGALCGRTAAVLIPGDILGTTRVISGAIGPYEEDSVPVAPPVLSDVTHSVQYGKAFSFTIPNAGDPIDSVAVTDPTHVPASWTVAVVAGEIVVSAPGGWS